MNKKWHRINLKIKLDPNGGPQFFIDLIIIDLWLRLTIEKFEKDIELWSFHRSDHPKDDKERQRLKINFYTSEKTANEILAFIKNNESYTIIFDNFLDANYMKEINLEFIGTEENSKKIEAISDKNWPIDIQKSWPYFITGACKMFINLITDIEDKYKNRIDKKNPKQLEEYYQKIEKEINQMWYEYGWHAFLHHLGAIFGYNFIKPKIRYLNNRGFIL